MPMIYVRTKPDRRAYFEGRVIPQDKFIPVTDTPYIQRLIHHWGDLEVEGGDDQKSDKSRRQASKKPHAPPAMGNQPQRPPSVRPNSPTLANPNTPAPGTGAPKPTN
jgi:hypothetical protein